MQTVGCDRTKAVARHRHFICPVYGNVIQRALQQFPFPSTIRPLASCLKRLKVGKTFDGKGPMRTPSATSLFASCIAASILLFSSSTGTLAWGQFSDDGASHLQPLQATSVPVTQIAQLRIPTSEFDWRWQVLAEFIAD